MNVHIQRSHLVNTEFLASKFNHFSIEGSNLNGLVLSEVELTTKLFFSFYQQGHRDFSRVQSLTGDLPSRLSSLPLAGAILPEVVVRFLIDKKFYNFKFSILKKIALDSILLEKGIPERMLELEGATFDQSKLSCSAQTNIRFVALRSSASYRKCRIYILLDSAAVTGPINKISLEDLRKNHESATVEVAYFKEVSLAYPPISLLTNPDEITIYWPYLPNINNLMQSIEFLKRSVLINSRQEVRVISYFTFSPQESNLNLYVNELYKLNFKQSYGVYYENAIPKLVAGDKHPIDTQLKSILKANLLSLSHPVSRTVPGSFEEQLIPKSNFLRLRKNMARLPLKFAKAGGHFDFLYTLLYFISRAIFLRNPKVQVISQDKKQRLKAFAQLIITEEATKKRASDYQRSLVLEVVFLCIDKNECSSEQLVYEDVVDSLNELKPDLVVGNEVFRSNLVQLFNNSASFLKEKFASLTLDFENLLISNIEFFRQKYALDNARKFFHNYAIKVRDIRDKNDLPEGSRSFQQEAKRLEQSELFDSANLNYTLSPEDLLASLNKMEWGEIKLYNWYDSNLVLELAKNINILLDALEYTTFETPLLLQEELTGLACNFCLYLNSYLTLTGLNPNDFFNTTHFKLFTDLVSVGASFTEASFVSKELKNHSYVAFRAKRSVAVAIADAKLVANLILKDDLSHEKKYLSSMTNGAANCVSWIDGLKQLFYYSKYFFEKHFFKFSLRHLVAPTTLNSAVQNPLADKRQWMLRAAESNELDQKSLRKEKDIDRDLKVLKMVINKRMQKELQPYNHAMLGPYGWDRVPFVESSHLQVAQFSRKNEKKAYGLQNGSVAFFSAVNDALLLANFSLKCVNYFFQPKIKSVQEYNNKVVKLKGGILKLN